MKSRTGASLLLVVIFLLGGVAGVLAHYLYQNHVAAAGSRQPNRNINSGGEIAQQMARTLELDDEQKEMLKAIFRQGRERFFALSEQFRPQYQQLRNKTNDEIRQILRADQKVRFDAFLKDMEKRLSQHRSRPR